MCGAANPIKAIEPTVLTAPPAKIDKAINATNRMRATLTPRWNAVASPSESRSSDGAIFQAMTTPIAVVIAIPIKLSEVINASEPKLQKEIERASARDTIAEAIPTKDVKIADTAIPTMIKAKDDKAPRIAANLNVRDVVNNAPIVPQAIAPMVPTCTNPELIASTAPKDAPAAVPRIAGSATALLQAPCANKPATPRAAPTITAAVTRGNLICHKISLLPGLITADQKLSICVAPT